MKPSCPDNGNHLNALVCRNAHFIPRTCASIFAAGNDTCLGRLDLKCNYHL
jgi:hypothetical protein